VWEKKKRPNDVKPMLLLGFTRTDSKIVNGKSMDGWEKGKSSRLNSIHSFLHNSSSASFRNPFNLFLSIIIILFILMLIIFIPLQSDALITQRYKLNFNFPIPIPRKGSDSESEF
jgi:hypothetical protein